MEQNGFSRNVRIAVLVKLKIVRRGQSVGCTVLYSVRLSKPRNFDHVLSGLATAQPHVNTHRKPTAQVKVAAAPAHLRIREWLRARFGQHIDV